MVAAAKTVTVTAETDLARVLEEAAAGPILLDKDGMLFRVSRVDDPWSTYDPDRARTTIRQMAGSIARTEAERIKHLIYEGREAGTRPPGRP